MSDDTQEQAMEDRLQWHIDSYEAEITTLKTEVTELRDLLESIKQYAAGKELLLKGSPELRSIINTISRALTTVTGEDNG